MPKLKIKNLMQIEIFHLLKCKFSTGLLKNTGRKTKCWWCDTFLSSAIVYVWIPFICFPLVETNHFDIFTFVSCSVLKRPVSTEELQKPGGPYIKKTFTIVGDAVGWGFVVRGNRPCHIQAVEPCGPAAAAGMKVCQFVVSVNGLNVLNLDYRTVSHLILTGPRTVVMEVMEETDH
ncbi:DEP domain-containing mTOR-interacting protein-like isoform X1 [Xiphias gladius]|uniref:DEP domain-containing mTOR-interacting protein-like isoform X1 n=1 Tax=Xiphias gladius TaxID=8245 RepID=UPI001A9A06F0|nr:DEP domain-containing mTOR-interacting protein-like isoform X1 [Xiphias gladius]XP_039977042.1 DEP domain-containing mTOR-interacting protein-like isoform X1 [Xiphias gladius]